MSKANDVSEAIINQRYKDLAYKIIADTCVEYTSVLNAMNRGRRALDITHGIDKRMSIEQDLRRKDCKRLSLEKFFKSSWFDVLSCGKVTGDEIIVTMRKRAGFSPEDIPYNARVTLAGGDE